MKKDFIDKCVARWHFEKNGVELYEKVLKICPNHLRQRFQEILGQEKSHQKMLTEVLKRYGADPESLTPSARVVEMETQAIAEVVDATSFKEAIDAVLTAELNDTANWEFLVIFADQLGDKECRDKFEQALKEEVEHVRFVRETILEGLFNRSPDSMAA
ncbi:MAG: DUF892 family protein [Bdellovibrionota bacterium]